MSTPSPEPTPTAEPEAALDPILDSAAQEEPREEPKPAPDPIEAGATDAEKPDPEPAPTPAGLEDLPEELLGFLQNQTLARDTPQATLEAVARSYRELHRMHSAGPNELIRIPKDASDEKAWSEIFTKLGRPEEASGYDLPEQLQVDDGDTITGPLLSGFREAAFAGGVSGDAAKAIIERFDADMAGIAQAMQEERTRQDELDAQRLVDEWGEAAAENQQAASQAVAASGLTVQDLRAVRGALGRYKADKLFARFGRGLLEHAVVDGHDPQLGATPGAAKDEIDALSHDKKFMDRLNAGDPAAQKQWDELFVRAYPAPKRE